MKSQYTWNELFIIAGFLFERVSPTEFIVGQESFDNLDFLYELLKTSHFLYSSTLKGIAMKSSPPALDKWLQALHDLGGIREENRSPEQLRLKYVDIPMLGVVRQLNRLGLPTLGSCSGHTRGNNPRQKHAYVDFQDTESARIAIRLIASLGYQVNLKRPGSVRVREDHSRLVDLGLELSEVRAGGW